MELKLFAYHLKENYKSSATAPFTSWNQFSKYGDLYKYLSTTIQDFSEKRSMNEQWVWDTWGPLSRVIYDQGLGVNTFAGLAEVVSDQMQSYTIKQGNSFFVERLLKESGAQVHLNSNVVSVTKLESGQYQVQTDSSDTYVFDKIVVAAPLEVVSISFKGFTVPAMAKRSYRHWYVTHVAADKLNPNYFNLPGGVVPDMVRMLLFFFKEEKKEASEIQITRTDIRERDSGTDK